MSKKYNKLVDAIKVLQETNPSDEGIQNWVNDNVPELNEDEQSKKWILEYLYDGLRKSDEQFKCQFKAAISWLEKQGKQKSSNNVEPKFHEGDCIVPYNITPLEIWKIINIGDDGYYNIQPITNIINTEGDEIYRIPGFILENDYYLWTIADARDSDVLTLGDIIFIFNKIHGVWVNCHCSLHKDGSFNDEDYDLMHVKYSKEVYPATKEQRDLLFQKMKEEGYEWDADKKELKKIVLKKLDSDKVIEWIHENVADFLDISSNPKNVINKFKKDFEL